MTSNKISKNYQSTSLPNPAVATRIQQASTKKATSGDSLPCSSSASNDQDSVTSILIEEIKASFARILAEYEDTFGVNEMARPLVAERRSRSYDADPVDDYKGVDESKTHWVETRSEDQVKFSIDRVKRLVLESLPEDVRDVIPPETWGRIFSNNLDSVVDEEMMSLQKNTTEEDVHDLVSYISIHLQREARGRRLSDVSEISHPYVDLPRRLSQMDAVALKLDAIPASVSSLHEPNTEEYSIEHMEKRQVPDSSVHRESAPDALVIKNAKSVLSGTALPENSLSSKQPTILQTVAPVAPPERGSKIRFGWVDVRYYEQIISDNPAVTSGPPIGIGWKYRIMKNSLTVDTWESRHGPDRRYLTALVLPRHERTKILYDLGYNQKQIALATRDVLKIKNNRKQTYMNLRFQQMEESMEVVLRRCKHVLTLGIPLRKKQKLLAPYAQTAK